jgi:hypothetical protein
MHNVYLSKQYALEHPQAIVWAYLSVTDHNQTPDRKPRKEPEGVEQYDIVEFKLNT